MLKIKCDTCRIQIEDETKFLGFIYKRNFCDKCERPKEFGVPSTSEKVFISNEYGFESKARVQEIDRRVMLPYERHDGGDYYVGRRGDDGVVHENNVDIRP